jgi:hypothetical protein
MWKGAGAPLVQHSLLQLPLLVRRGRRVGAVKQRGSRGQQGTGREGGAAGEERAATVAAGGGGGGWAARRRRCWVRTSIDPAQASLPQLTCCQCPSVPLHVETDDRCHPHRSVRCFLRCYCCPHNPPACPKAPGWLRTCLNAFVFLRSTVRSSRHLWLSRSPSGLVSCLIHHRSRVRAVAAPVGVHRGRVLNVALAQCPCSSCRGLKTCVAPLMLLRRAPRAWKRLQRGFVHCQPAPSRLRTARRHH